MTSAPSSLPDAILGHAARDPEEPWLFYAEGWDWRWLPWGELARRMEAEAGRLAGVPAGARVPFFYDAQPDGVMRDLAIQAAGLVSAPSRDLTPWPPETSPPGENIGGAVMVDAGQVVEV